MFFSIVLAVLIFIPLIQVTVDDMVMGGATNALATQLAGKLNASLACPTCFNPRTLTQLNISLLSTMQSNYVDLHNLSAIDSHVLNLLSVYICFQPPGLIITNGDTQKCIGITQGSTCNPCNAGYVTSQLFTCISHNMWSGSPVCCLDPNLPSSHGSALFVSGGTFNLPSGYSAACPVPTLTVVMIGGGGGGGQEWGSGGNSGYLTTGRLVNFTAQSTNVVIGAGGSGCSNTGGGCQGSSGGSSSFGSFFSANGGTGGLGSHGCSSQVGGWSAGGGACYQTGEDFLK